MGHLEVGSTDHFEGISASPIRGQARAEMARIHHRSPTMETLTLTQKEQARLQVLNSLLAEHMTLDQAATLMGVSARHTRRILAAYRREGAAALAHGNRGLRSTNATPEPLRSEVLRLAQTRYPDANHTRGILKKCVNSQAVYPLSEQHGLKARERRYTAHEEGKHWE